MIEIPPIEKQSEIIGQIDELIELSKKEIKELEEMRTTLLVHWSVKGDKEAFKKIFDGDRYGEHILKRAPQKARNYFTMHVVAWRERIRQRE
jgi:restriction endonuclease S subunit